VKVDWRPDPDGLIEHANSVARLARIQLESDGIEDNPALLSYNLQTLHLKLRKLPVETQKLLLTDSISPLPLHKTLVLLDHLKQNADERYLKHELLALAKALVFTSSNLHFGPEVGVGRIKPDAPVIAPWLDNLHVMADDLHKLEKQTVTAKVHQADSRQLLAALESGSIDAVISSPPYPNEKDYTRTTRLETVLLGFIQNKKELRAIKNDLMRSNTRNVYKGDRDDEWVSTHAEIQRIADAIEARRIELGKTSGFEKLYAKVTRLYFGGMTRHLSEMRRVLRPGAKLAYVVGDQASYLQIMIRTGQLTADIAQSLGYELLSIDLFRTRLSTATKQQLREEVVVLRWPGR
jgi:hypothetical protein